jgi:putative methionine-R-sulfoxide reductase with GAF domain
MKIRILLLAAILWFICFTANASDINYTIENGVLNLEQVDIHKAQVIKLQGNCEFYWNQLLEPKDFKASEGKLNPIYVKIPKPWTKYQIDSVNIPNEGYATYRFIIKKQADLTETIYALKVSTIFCSYKLWANGKLLIEVGKVGMDKSTSQPSFKYRDIPIILDPDKENTEEIEVIFQVSNFDHQRAGMQRPIFFGTHENLSKETRSKDILNLIILGIIIVIGINHLNMYLFRRKDTSNFYFSVVCIVMALRNITTSDRIITYMFPNINWEFLVKLDNFSGFGTVPLFALFFYSLFKVDFPKILKNFIIFSGVLVTVLVFFTPAIFYSKFRIIFEVYVGVFGLYLTFGVAMVSAIRRRPTAFFTFLGMFILYATAINDILISMGVVQGVYLAPYGLVAFMLIQSMTITIKSAKAINQNEKLSDALILEKENLEENINERTKELQQQHNQLLKHQEKEKEQGWINIGMNKINDILADNKNDFRALSSKVLTQLISYVNATFGVLYMLSDEDDNEPVLELIADYGCSNDIRKDKAKIHVTTGIVGVSFTENRLMVINNIPENYIKIESGLGESQPESLLVIPLSIDEKVFGIIELASFKKFTEIEVEFIKRIADNIANNLNIIRMNENSSGMIKKFEEQTLLMQEKEEEMRQNLEEMEAIREQYEELLKKSE